MTDHVMRWRGAQVPPLRDTTRELDVEGALRASKTTLCLRKVLNSCLDHPGIHWLICRWTDDDTHSLLAPAWRTLCAQSGVSLTWNGAESYDQMSNGSLIYVRGLKAQDVTLRYSKFRGLTLAGVYVDQGEELPKDVYLELAGRLSQPGFPQQIIISPQSVSAGHWIDQEFPEDNHLPHRKYYHLSVRDNAHNLDPAVIENLERLFPPGHPQHRTLVLGLRGMSVVGEPVYKGAFMRQIHERKVEYDAKLPLDMSLDFGKHHPCVLFRQVSALGQARYLGGVLGQALYLDDFIEIVLRHRDAWFPSPVETRECCDPAGASDTSHGTAGAVSLLAAKGVYPISREDANSPAVRLAMIERIASQMRRRAPDNSEAFAISNSDRWLRVSAQSTVVDHFYADGCEAGYVWDDHMVSVSNKQMRRPKKDGWYEHAQNCAEYLEATFGSQQKPSNEPEEEMVTYRPASPYL